MSILVWGMFVLVLLSRVKEQHKPLAHLMKFPFFAAEVESHLQAFLEGLIKRRR